MTTVSVLYVLNTGLLYSLGFAREQVGRSLLAFLEFNSDLGVRRQERKVRTLQGSEPANGGAYQQPRI
ncbi:hypothetical protein BH18ACI4_BH18ACI4_09530 [soil metagenome]